MAVLLFHLWYSITHASIWLSSQSLSASGLKYREKKDSHLSVSFMTISILPQSWPSALEFFENSLFIINMWCHYCHLLIYIMSQWTSVQIMSTAFPMCSFYIISLNIALNGLPGICLHGYMYTSLFLHQPIFLQMDYNLIAC